MVLEMELKIRQINLYIIQRIPNKVITQMTWIIIGIIIKIIIDHKIGIFSQNNIWNNNQKQQTIEPMDVGSHF